MQFKVKFDGSWIDMNEPSVFGTNKDHPWWVQILTASLKMDLLNFLLRYNLTTCSRYYDSPDHPNIPPLFCPTQGDDAYWENAPYQTQAVYHYGQVSN